MGVARKILRMALILFGVIFLFSLIGAHLGHKGLVIVGEIDLPIWALYVICTLLFWVCSLFITALIIEEYTAKIFLYLLPFFIFDFILQIFYSNGLTSGLLPILYLLALGVRLKKIKLAFLIRALVVLGGIAFYTFGMRVIKTGKVTLDPNDVAPFQALISSIDLIILLVAAYAYGGVKYYAKKLEMVFPHGSEIDKMGGEDEIALAALKKLRGFSKTQVVLLLLCLNIFQWLAIILVCAIGDVLVEGIAITSSFILFGFIIHKRWHSKSIIICTIASASLFYVAAKIIPSFGYTQFLPVLIGLLLIYSLYRVALYQDKIGDMERELCIYKKYSKPNGDTR